jgi:hypothetical protein
MTILGTVVVVVVGFTIFIDVANDEVLQVKNEVQFATLMMRRMYAAIEGIRRRRQRRRQVKVKGTMMKER